MSGRVRSGEGGQVLLGLVAGLLAVLVGVVVLGAMARGVGAQSSAQRAADLGALAGARAMHASYPRLFEPAVIAGAANVRHLGRAEYLARARTAAGRVAVANGAPDADVGFPDGGSFWVAPPGRSLHRYGTELDLGPRSAYAWLAANASRFGFIQRYSWEPWHYEDH